MDARQYLNQARVISAKLTAKREEIEEIESLLLQGVSFEEKSGSVSPTNKNERIVFKLIELKDELNHQLVDLISKQTAIMETIDRLNTATEITVLHKRYIQFKPFRTIAEELNYSARQVYRIHDDAVIHVQNILNDVTQCHN